MSTTITDADRKAAAGAAHNAIAAFVRLCAADDATLTETFDYRIDIHRTDGSREPLIYRAD